MLWQEHKGRYDKQNIIQYHKNQTNCGQVKDCIKKLAQNIHLQAQPSNHHRRNLTTTQKLKICTKSGLSRVDEGAPEVLPAGAVGPVAFVAPGKARPFPGSEDLGAGITPPGSAGEIGDGAGEELDVSSITSVGGSITAGNWCTPAIFGQILDEN